MSFAIHPKRFNNSGVSIKKKKQTLHKKGEKTIEPSMQNSQIEEKSSEGSTPDVPLEENNSDDSPK
jgi:hypothetical protein